MTQPGNEPQPLGHKVDAVPLRHCAGLKLLSANFLDSGVQSIQRGEGGVASDLELHCLQRQSISGFCRTRV